MYVVTVYVVMAIHVVCSNFYILVVTTCKR